MVTGHSLSDAFRKFPFLCCEIPARRKICCSHRIALDPNWLDHSADLFAEPHHFQRFFDVQIARLTLGVTPIVIVHTICNVRMLLYLTEDQPRSDGMSRSGGNEYRISGMYRNTLQTILRRTLRYRVPKFLHIDAPLQSHHDLRTFSSPHRVPHFRFAAPPGSLLVPRSIIIIRMNLYRKLVFDEQKFHEQRERIVAAL